MNKNKKKILDAMCEIFGDNMFKDDDKNKKALTKLIQPLLSDIFNACVRSVLPEKMPLIVTKYKKQKAKNNKDYSDGWNACLDQIKSNMEKK